MIIRQTQQAIKFYKLAIQNAQNQLEFQVNQDEEYQDFQKRFQSIGTTLFYNHTSEFAFYNFETDIKIDYFHIKNGEIVYRKDSDSLDKVQDVAQELLSIVGKFYK